MNEAQRLARLVLIVGAIWSGSFALLAPPDTPPVVAAGQIVFGAVGAVVCAGVAWRPTEQRIQVAFFGAAGYAAWNAVRVYVVPDDARSVIRGVATHAFVATFCLAAAAMFGILARLERLATAVDNERP